MDLYIVRHGEAHPGNNDAARMLTDRGRADVNRVATAANLRGASVRQVRHSGRERARETAEIIAGVLDPPAGVIATSGIHPEDDIDPIALSLFGERDSLMLVGHLPFVARFVGLLTLGDANRSPVKFPTATIACLHGQDDQWELAWTEHPD